MHVFGVTSSSLNTLQWWTCQMSLKCWWKNMLIRRFDNKICYWNMIAHLRHCQQLVSIHTYSTKSRNPILWYYKFSIYCGYIRYDSAHSTTIRMIQLRLDLQTRKTPYSSPLRGSYAYLVSHTKKNDRNISRPHCTTLLHWINNSFGNSCEYKQSCTWQEWRNYELQPVHNLMKCSLLDVYR